MSVWSNNSIRLCRATLKRRERRAFDEGDFFGCELVEFVHELINLLVGGPAPAAAILQHGLFRIRRGRGQLGHHGRRF